MTTKAVVEETEPVSTQTKEAKQDSKGGELSGKLQKILEGI